MKIQCEKYYANKLFLNKVKWELPSCKIGTLNDEKDVLNDESDDENWCNLINIKYKLNETNILLFIFLMFQTLKIPNFSVNSVNLQNYNFHDFLFQKFIKVLKFVNTVKYSQIFILFKEVSPFFPLSQCSSQLNPNLYWVPS